MSGELKPAFERSDSYNSATAASRCSGPTGSKRMPPYRTGRPARSPPVTRNVFASVRPDACCGQGTTATSKSSL